MNKIKKISAALSGASLLLVMAGGYALAAPENFGGKSDTWYNDYGNHYVNTNNPENRKDWDNHRFAVPGNAWMHANDNAAVMDNGGYTLVDPHDTL